MKYLNRFLCAGIITSLTAVANGAVAIQPQNIDLHQQSIGLWNFEEKVDAILPTPSSSEVFSINLSDNSLRDNDVQSLMESMNSHNLINHVRVLNLSNNRLTLEGVKALLPLLCSDQLEWLDVSINNLMVNDFTSLWELIESEARKRASIQDLPNHEAIRDKWASKLVLLPESYNLERFAFPKPLIAAHQGYYRTK